METFELWLGEVPGGVLGESNPQITYYPTEKKAGDGCVVIFPGGAYHGLAPHEGKDYAEYLNGIGLSAFVVKYRVFPNRFPYILLDARRAVRFVRANAEKFGVNPHKIAVMGSSAGGHLAALVSNYRKELPGECADEIDKADYLPDATVLCYPVITGQEDEVRHFGSFKNLLGEENASNAPDFSVEKLVDDQTPPAFIWHTSADAGVNVINSYRYATAMREQGKTVEMHIFPYGAHGLGLAKEEYRTMNHLKGWQGNYAHVSQWAGLLDNWLTLIDFKK